MFWSISKNVVISISRGENAGDMYCPESLQAGNRGIKIGENMRVFNTLLSK